MPVSELYRKRKLLEAKLLELESLDTGNPATQSSSQFAASCFGSHDLSSLRHRRHSFRGRDSPEHRGTEKEISAAAEAIESGAPLDLEQIQSFQRLIEWEIDSLTEELKGQCLVTDNHYPKNLTIGDFYGFIPLPTLIYELEYPRQEKINWVYVAEKTAATFGVIGVMIAISQAWIYPVVMSAVQMKKEGLTLHQRLKEFPWVLSDLIFPFMMEYLLTFYVIWECVVSIQLSPDLSIRGLKILLLDFVTASFTVNNSPTAQCSRRNYQVRRPRVLRRLVELRFLGSVCARLESAST